MRPSCPILLVSILAYVSLSDYMKQNSFASPDKSSGESVTVKAADLGLTVSSVGSQNEKKNENCRKVTILSCVGFKFAIAVCRIDCGMIATATGSLIVLLTQNSQLLKRKDPKCGLRPAAKTEHCDQHR